MKEVIKENLKSKRAKFFVLIGALVFLGTLVGAAYAFFIITSTNDATNTTSGGNLSLGTSLVTDTSNLYLNLDSVLMSEANVGTKYYATTESNGVPITNPSLGNGIYTLATVSLNQEGIFNTCTYGYNISATLANPISDGSDEDIKITIKGDSVTGGEITYTLKQLVQQSQTLTGTFERIEAGYDQTVTIESTMENTNTDQSDFQGNSYIITLTPTTFSCVVSADYEQLVNYTMLYDNGIENIAWTAVQEANATATKQSDHLYCVTSSSNSRRLAAYVGESVNITNYDSYFIKMAKTSQAYLSAYSSFGGFRSISSINNNNYTNNSITMYDDAPLYYDGVARLFISSLSSVKELGNNLYPYVGALTAAASGITWNKIYSFGLLKNDNWQSLCTKAGISTPSDIATLLADSTSLIKIFNSRDAVNYMARQCTGDFMALAVQSSTFKTALQSSRYKSIIESNEHWAKFLAMANNS